MRERSSQVPSMACVLALSTLLLPGFCAWRRALRRPRQPAPGAAATARRSRRRRQRARPARSRSRAAAHRRPIDGADDEFDITRIAITDPKIADAVVVQPREVLIDGKSAGTVSLIIWGDAGACSTTSSSIRA